MSFRLARWVGIVGSLLTLTSVVHAADLTIHVAGRDSVDYELAQSKPDSERSLFRALNKAVGHLNKPGPQRAFILVASGPQTGQAGNGSWEIERINNPEATLVILGGLTNGFKARNPFAKPTQLMTNKGRSTAVLQLASRSVIKKLVISGFWFDGADSNSYDAETNSILRDTSRTLPLVGLSAPKVNELIIADNMFINAAHGAYDIVVQPLTKTSRVEIRNNAFINNIKTMKLGGGVMPMKEILVKNNSFILNWPYNLDTTSSNVGVLELHTKDSAESVTVEGNLFAYNVAGAMQHDWTESRIPKLKIVNNLFYRNGMLFEPEALNSGIFVGKFGSNGIHRCLNIEQAEDDFGYTVEKNVVADPGLKVDFGFQTDEDGDDVTMSGFAPRQLFAPELMVPAEAFKGYGVQFSDLYQP
jgi:hypothetical protein